MLKYLLDTNIVIYVIKRRPVEVMGVFNQNAGRMAISAITLGELHHGPRRAQRSRRTWP
jgi:tRNA(fMet)-specific endonuclease VapC